jgi:hypothetical protein
MIEARNIVKSNWDSFKEYFGIKGETIKKEYSKSVRHTKNLISDFGSTLHKDYEYMKGNFSNFSLFKDPERFTPKSQILSMMAHTHYVLKVFLYK